MKETWKPIAGYQDYEVSNLGRVRSWRIKGNTSKPVVEPRILKYSTCGEKRKYLAVKLYNDDRGKSHRVHRLVLEAFVGPMPKGRETRHINGNSFDNVLDNLRYGTHQENMADQKIHGTRINLFGEAHGRSKMTETQVIELRNIYASGAKNQYELAKKYGIDQTTVSLIVRRKKWKHI